MSGRHRRVEAPFPLTTPAELEEFPRLIREQETMIMSKQLRRFVGYRPNPPEDYRAKGIAAPPDEPQYEGVVFADGSVAVRWRTAFRSTSVWPDWETFYHVHGHEEYGTRIEWLDEQADDRAALDGFAAEQQRRWIAAASLIQDLDRCQHGRHVRDNCFGCPGGKSTGNLELNSGLVVGHGVRGELIVVPPMEDRGDPAMWRSKRVG